jgi:hypothetical protein
MLKRLRFYLWVALCCIIDEVEPLPCPAVNPFCKDGCCFCSLVEGHTAAHLGEEVSEQWTDKEWEGVTDDGKKLKFGMELVRLEAKRNFHRH